MRDWRPVIRRLEREIRRDGMRVAYDYRLTPTTAFGKYLPKDRTIAINPRKARAGSYQRMETLTHELAHHRLQHTGRTPRRKREIEATLAQLVAHDEAGLPTYQGRKRIGPNAKQAKRLVPEIRARRATQVGKSIGKALRRWCG